ncbi:ribonuclease H2 subunit A isoform X2 [Cimex lectularius]|nr:ribonuclease H2 subunit A isoform X2 [Cimex lectularius]
MVYGICYCPKSKQNLLEESGCADSKTLTEQKREEIFEKLCEKDEDIKWEVKVISPTDISNCMLRRQKYSLNEISHSSAIGLLQKAIDEGANITDVFVDTVGPADKYQAKLQEIFPHLNVTVANKADSKYPIVGAASICAKVIRDICLRVWKYPEIKEDEKIVCGSGYPGDPDTKKFLTKYMDPVFGFPSVVRFSWATASKILEESAITVEWEEVEDEKTKGIKSVKSFFSKVDDKSKERFRYFKERGLTNCTEF